MIPVPDQSNNLLQLIDNIENTSVLVVGDVMLDRFVYGHVERISPESPVPVLSIDRESGMPGGAGNALSNLKGLGARGIVLSVVGEDENGAALRQVLQNIGVPTEGLLSVSDRPTILKTRFLAGHQQLLRTDYEKKLPISKATQDALLQKAKELIGGVKAVILSDYGKGLLTEDLIKGIIDLAKKQGVPVLVDPKGFDYSIYKGASAVTPNKKELSEATQGMPTGTDEEVIAAARKLIETSGVEAVIATRSKDGMSVVTKKDVIHLKGADIEVFDVSGAGDTVISTVAAGLAAGGSLADSAQLANMAGGIVVTKVGTAPIRAAELRDALRGDKQRSARKAHICGWDEAREEVSRWKARGLKVGFTNGCFDILHYGHVTYLNDARDKCDRLIVGLNHDASVKILKGPERPVHDEQSRAAVLGALGSVDMVVFFGAEQAGGDNTANALIAQLQPDLYFKGGDYKVEQIPEAPGVMAYGGKVMVMPVQEGHSTTNSIKKSKTKAA